MYCTHPPTHPTPHPPTHPTLRHFTYPAHRQQAEAHTRRTHGRNGSNLDRASQDMITARGPRKKSRTPAPQTAPEAAATPSAPGQAFARQNWPQSVAELEKTTPIKSTRCRQTAPHRSKQQQHHLAGQCARGSLGRSASASCRTHSTLAAAHTAKTVRNRAARG